MTTLPFTIEYMKERMQAAYKAGTLLAQADPDPLYGYYYRKEGSEVACAVGTCFDAHNDIPTLNKESLYAFTGELTGNDVEFFADKPAFDFAATAQLLHDSWCMATDISLGLPSEPYEAAFRQHIGL